MIATIVLIAAFQGYWLNRLYHDERKGLEKEADVLFREAVYKLQMKNFRKDSLFNKSLPDNLFIMNAVTALRKATEDHGDNSKMVFSLNTTSSTTINDVKKGDSARVIISTSPPGERVMIPAGEPRRNDFTKIIVRSSLGDSLSVQQIDSAYRKELEAAKVNMKFFISSCEVDPHKPECVPVTKPVHVTTNYVTVGLAHPIAYRAEIPDVATYLLGRILYPILISLFLIAITTTSFVFLYRNLVAQRRLTEIKNEFISNITHELKTPIATVNVAIEALKNFNAIDNPQRTKEYLDISSSELQRLSLLVDKVLKLSLFENKDIELKKEKFDLRQLTEEVIKTMQLQFQKQKAVLDFDCEGTNFMIEADKLHITSVVYNLLDNALKYSPEQPAIHIHLAELRNSIRLQVKDNGIGIPAAYHQRVFEKFFRVPHGNTHNIKGYGLGLSYVHHVVIKHQGSIEVSSEPGQGTTFTVNFLKTL